MTNREWLLNKMQNMSDKELAKMIVVPAELEKEKDCMFQTCPSLECDICIEKWLQAEHKEPITLSEAERIILENIDKEYKWICRDKDNTLKLYIYKPKNHKGNWFVNEATVCYRLECFNHLFQFITWDDDEPYNIAELLEGK